MIEPVAKDKCLPELVALFPELVAHRHDIHQHPDCGFETKRTIEKIKAVLGKAQWFLRKTWMTPLAPALYLLNLKAICPARPSVSALTSTHSG